jgi:hypothetical protein
VHWLADLNNSAVKNPNRYILEEVILTGEYEEFSIYCPEWKPVVEEIVAKIAHLKSECEKIYERIHNMEKK